MTRLSDASYFSSRLLGQNRFFSEPGAVIDIALKQNNEAIARLYVEELGKLLALLPIKDYEIKVKIFANGINIALRYPYDLLMVACEILDWVWADICDYLDEQIALDTNRAKRRFKRIIKENQHLLLRKIYTKARVRQVNFIHYKDLIILGSGIRQFRSKLNKITKLGDIPWKKIGDIPIAIITGTNGKTTTTRLTEFICRRAKLNSGYCSTDWVMVNGKQIAEGDLSGPTGHQLVLIQPKLEVAILEAARGGMIKRGLLPNYASCATVTNIAEDHLGQNGIDTLADLAAAKGLVYSGLKSDGIAIVNLDDPYTCQLSLNQRKAYLSTRLKAKSMTKLLEPDNFVVYIEDDYIYLKTLKATYQLNSISQIPLTISGLARYNYENALHAVALCYALGITPKQISRGLSKFGADDKSNFGRWNHYISTQNGHLVVDIAHNPAGLNNILQLATSYRQLHQLNGKLGLVYGITADRRDSIDEIVNLIKHYQVDEVIIKEFQQTLRGSALGEMPEVFHQELLRQGYPAHQIKIIPNELEAVTYVLKHATSNDFHLLCCHDLLSEVSKILRDTLKQEAAQ